MAINLVVAVTDYDWFQTLRVREDWPEVNFWAPSGANFRALQPGELFFSSFIRLAITSWAAACLHRL